MRKAESRGFASLGRKLSSLPAEAGPVGQGPAAPFWALLPGTAPCWAARVPPDPPKDSKGNMFIVSGKLQGKLSSFRVTVGDSRIRQLLHREQHS